MKQRLKKIIKTAFLLVFLSGILFADVQDEVTDTSLQNTYNIKDGSVISASNLRTLFMKLVSGAWTANGTSISYNKGNVGIGIPNPAYKLHVVGEDVGIFNNVPNGDARFKLYNSNNICEWFLGQKSGGSSFIMSRAVAGVETDYVALTNEGNLGIGTLNPVAKLDVNGILYLRKNDNGNEGGEIQFQGSGSNPGWSQDIYDNMMRFWVHGNNSGDNLVLFQNGNVGIGIAGMIPTEKLTVAGNIYTSGTVTQASDFRYKKNIQTLENPLEKILSLHGVSFEWKTEEYQDKHFSEGKTIGFIAQEAEKVVPEVVQTAKDGYKSMAYANITALLVEAVKELKLKNDEALQKLQSENEILKERVLSLETQNQELLKKLSSYESKMEKIDAMLINLNQKLR
ncbi:MAG: hypothetical protein A2Y41_03700 [Spirochaetes bacterium GWB1_36_13]|nr:MAG: hypothetical protein A2Y41_03700 [Spirochaetes bacterium GWB1_36_13]